MYYTYSSMAGRIVATTHARAYAPQGLHALRVMAVPEAVSLQPRVAATLATTAPTHVKTGLASATREGFQPLSDKTKHLQELFQKNDDVMVYLKRGTSDKLLYWTTGGLCGGGFAAICYYFSYMIFQP